MAETYLYRRSQVHAVFLNLSAVLVGIPEPCLDGLAASVHPGNMARKRIKAETPIEPEIATTAEAPEESSPRRSIVVRLDEAGRADLSSLRDSTKAKLREAFSGSDLFQTPGGESSAENLEAKKTGLRVVVPPLYKVLGGLEALVAAWSMKLKLSQTSEVMEYSEEEIAALLEPTVSVLAKRIPESFGYEDELALVLLLFALHQSKLAGLVKLKAEATGKLVSIQPESKEETAIQ